MLPNGITGSAFEAMALEAGVQVYAAERFAVGTVKPPAAVRLAIGSVESREELIRGLEIIAKLLNQFEKPGKNNPAEIMSKNKK
jgi:DNA-binding transcriptional MocR family regulator